MINHAKEAEKLLRSAQQLPATDEDAAIYPATEDGSDTVAHAIAAAQVHATLAMAQQVEALVLHFAHPQRFIQVPDEADVVAALRSQEQIITAETSNIADLIVPSPGQIPLMSDVMADKMYTALEDVVRKMTNTAPMLASWPQATAEIKRVMALYRPVPDLPTRPQCRSTFMPRGIDTQHCTKPLSHIAESEKHGNADFTWGLTPDEELFG